MQRSAVSTACCNTPENLRYLECKDYVITDWHDTNLAIAMEYSFHVLILDETFRSRLQYYFFLAAYWLGLGGPKLATRSSNQGYTLH